MASPDLACPPCSAAFGYVCVDDGNEDLIDYLHRRLAGYALGAGLSLVEVYVDRETPAERSERPALGILLDQMGRYPGALMLVVDEDQLPAVPAARAVVDERLAETGGALQVIPEKTGVHEERDSPLVTEAGVAAESCWVILVKDLQAIASLLPGGDRPVLTVPEPRYPPILEPRAVPDLGDTAAGSDGVSEVTVTTGDSAAQVAVALARLPVRARFVESYGDVDTTLVFSYATEPSARSEASSNNQIQQCEAPPAQAVPYSAQD
ncbi:hypothetical protein I6A84_02235 [Frankia sp. CNm7]|uniref:Uncharacterized protein n=1 Tax=Frankia nepalensis TaxID=1836974 RepID=A0A937RKJ7_9ACTN|nr:hypothetical protein [Frankia nepalensis]MBL7499881.1 hypothetical protein [Frankia nepalensis]MBL7512301.1 hypothetical protein [Frankia nepalensis]MBL7516976.1 hypothetical protein [Frankia nepalensis]MBL7631985.1 hypothetical protein [Frankia nepalensis]